MLSRWSKSEDTRIEPQEGERGELDRGPGAAMRLPWKDRVGGGGKGRDMKRGSGGH